MDGSRLITLIFLISKIEMPMPKIKIPPTAEISATNKSEKMIEDYWLLDQFPLELTKQGLLKI